MRDAPPWFEEYIDGNNRQVKLDIAVGAQIDMTAASDAVLSNTGKMPHSVPSQIWDGNVAYNRYALFARGGWETAPMRSIVTPDGQTSPQAGVVSDKISNADREIDWEMNIAFTREHSSGLTIYFQDDMVAEDFDIIVDDAVIQTSGGGGMLPPGEVGVSWEINNGVLSITPAFMGSRALIPDYAEGGAPWYERASEITALDISGMVFGIGTNAFFGLTELTDVRSLGSSIFISSGAFKGCTSLQSIRISNLIGEIFGDAFGGCIALQNVEILGHPQVYSGAISLGSYDKMVECAITGIVVSNDYGNRYTKLWQGTIGTTSAYDIYDNCLRIFGSGVSTPPSAQAGWMFEELLIFPRITTVNNATNWTVSGRGTASIYLGEALDTFNLAVGAATLLSVRNGLSRPRTYAANCFANAVNMLGGFNLAVIPGTGAGPITTFLNCKNLTEIVCSFPTITVANDGYRLGTMFDGCDSLATITGPDCEGNVLYGRTATSGNNTYAFLFNRAGDTLMFRTGTTVICSGEAPSWTSVRFVTVNVDNVDISAGVANFIRINGEADTVIVRGSRIYTPGAINCRRLYGLQYGDDGATTSTNSRKTGDMKLEIVDLVGGIGMGSSDYIRQYYLVNCPNIKEIRIRQGAVGAAIQTTYCNMAQLNTSAPLKTFNVFSASGVPASGSYTAFVRVGDVPPREVS